VHKDPDRLPEEGLSRPLFKKRKHPLISLTLFLLTFAAAVTVLFFFFDGADLLQSVEALLS
jgi:hypothetical protein